MPSDGEETDDEDIDLDIDSPFNFPEGCFGNLPCGIFVFHTLTGVAGAKDVKDASGPAEKVLPKVPERVRFSDAPHVIVYEQLEDYEADVFDFNICQFDKMRRQFLRDAGETVSDSDDEDSSMGEEEVEKSATCASDVTAAAVFHNGLEVEKSATCASDVTAAAVFHNSFEVEKSATCASDVTAAAVCHNGLEVEKSATCASDVTAAAVCHNDEETSACVVCSSCSATLRDGDCVSRFVRTARAPSCCGCGVAEEKWTGPEALGGLMRVSTLEKPKGVPAMQQVLCQQWVYS